MKTKSNFVSAHIRKYPFAFAGILLAGFVNSTASFLLPVSIGEFFTLQFHTGSSKAKLLTRLGVHLETIQHFFLFFVVLLIIKAITSYLENLGTYRQGELFVKNIREKIFASQINWEISSLSRGTYGKYLLRYSNDMKSVQNYFMKGILDGAKNLLFLLTGLFMLSSIHLMLTLILFSLLLLIKITIYFLSAYQKPFISASRTNRSSLLAFVAKKLSGFEKLKRNQTEQDTIENFNLKSENLYRANMRSNKIESLLQSSASSLIFVMIGILLWQMTMPFVHISAGHGLMVILMVMMMQGALKKILKVPGYLNKGNISLEKINKLLQPQSGQPEVVESLSQ